MNIIGIIPARMSSSRFPGKPLADIYGMAMIRHVYLRSAMSDTLGALYVATPDKEIKDYCVRNDMRFVMTKDTHERASDRAAEAMLKIEKTLGRKTDILVMIQGDEPMVYPEMIDLAVRPLIRDRKILVSNLMSPLKTREEFSDPNEVKVVVDEKGFALYFSREPIPSEKKGARDIPMLKQVCIIPFRRDFLLRFNRLSQTAPEKIESVDMLRCLGHGYKVKMIRSDFNTYSVDTPKDLENVKKAMKKDRLFREYHKGKI
ncbi:MAG: 3-deoxy-manno-octulosonate cytidylyltransferase [Candidatus Omnitrophota bacterium]